VYRDEYTIDICVLYAVDNETSDTGGDSGISQRDFIQFIPLLEIASINISVHAYHHGAIYKYYQG